MKIVALSDTHGRHNDVTLPDGEMIIHAGDCTLHGKESEAREFMEWFVNLDYQYKLFIAGNHDFCFERNPEALLRELPDDVFYLNDSGVTIEGHSIWGSPVQPWFHNWAFNRERGAEIKQHWDLIPDHTDVLITHGPPHGVLDKTFRQKHVGCEELIRRIREVQPQFFICGHIHEAYGQLEDEGTTYINASVLDERYALVNEPIVFEL